MEKRYVLFPAELAQVNGKHISRSDNGAPKLVEARNARAKMNAPRSRVGQRIHQCVSMRAVEILKAIAPRETNARRTELFG